MRYLTSLNTKLTVLVALPLVALVVAAGLGAQRSSRGLARERSTTEAVELTLAAAAVARQLTLEGELSGRVVAPEAEAEDMSSEAETEAADLSSGLLSQRRKTDKVVDAFQHAVDHGSEAARHHLADASDGLDQIGDTREGVDDRRRAPAEVVDAFAAIADRTLDTDRLLADGDDVELALRLDAYLALTRAISTMAREQSLVEAMLRSGVVDPGTYGNLVETSSGLRHWLDRFEERAPTEDLDRYLAAEATPARGALLRLLDRAVAAGPGGPSDGDPRLWSNTASRRIDSLDAVAQDVASELAAGAAAAESAAASRQAVARSWFAAALALAVGMLMLLQRLVLAPTRRLARASHPAADTLTKAVVRAETKREAMNTVFLNFGLRTQELVTRQLSHIDSLEARAESPDTLSDLFLLDHLATRLRRNAESLMVLAGADSPRPWARPVSVTNLVRAAVAEAADYSRVDLEPMAPAMVAGPCANDLAHLLAELIDKALALSISSPRRVTIAGRAYHDGGYLITVADVASSMSPAELAETNAQLARMPTTEVGTDRDFGLFVAGQIAQRYHVAVQLVPSAGHAVAAEVLLPCDLVLHRELGAQPAHLAALQ